MDMIIEKWARTPGENEKEMSHVLEATDAALLDCAGRLTSLLPHCEDDDEVRNELLFLLSDIQAARAALTSRYLQC